MSDIIIKVEGMAGADIPGSLIPQMVNLANKVGCCVQSKLNDVITIAYPGDDAFDLAVAWKMAISSKHSPAFAFARDGKKLMEQPHGKKQ